MKQTSFWTACIFVFSLVAVSCNNSDDSPDPSNNNSQVLTQGGTWKVTYYFDKDKVETSDFSGYTFNFQSSGAFESTRNGTTTTGSWQTTSDDGSQRLVISTSSSSKPLSNLDDNWIIVTMTDSKIELKDDNTEHLEELHFEKL
ncbi:MAG: hypothetical protein H6577_02090 [Lewinellaceae bacterium]|nr:hypothetical protein [Saprospiraceae bacterium]MCB9336898.1 hypothetical protein [Lewinellaceae bacterium]